MERKWLAMVLVPCLVGLVVLGLKGAGTGSAQQLPTPEGQLGGPMSLTPPAGQESPPPTPSEEATPQASPVGPEGCTVAPLPIETAVALLRGTEVRSEDAGSASTPTASGEEISTAFDIFVACVNGGDYLRLAAITTPEFFQKIVSGTGWSSDEIETNLSSLHPRAPEQYLQILAHGPVLMLNDSLATETVVILEPASPLLGEVEVGVTFERVGGQWLVAGVTPVE